MSIPEAKATDTQTNTETSQETENNASKSEPSFEDNVSNAISQMTQDASGEWQFPDTITDEAIKYAAVAEQRYRNTQSSYTKARQKNKALEAEKALLRKKVVGTVPVQLTAEQKEELEELKFSNPDEWRTKLNQYEAKARAEYDKQLEDEVKQVSTTTLEADELASRAEVLTQFNREFPDFHIDDDVIANDIPPRITNKLDKGEISFREFLTECHEYSKTGKVVKQPDSSTKMTNLSKMGGGDTPDANAMKEDAITTYDKEVY